MGRVGGRESCASRRQPELSRDEHRSDAGIRATREVFARRYCIQVRPDVRAHSVTCGDGARASHVATGESASRGTVKSFAYLRPESLDELLTMMRLHGPGARLL